MIENILDEEFRENPERTVSDIIKWWEGKRRWRYNKIVGLTGIFFVALSAFTNWNAGILSFMIAIAYAVLANFCYTLGWLTEIILLAIFGDQEWLRKVGPVLYVLGLVLSLFLTVSVGGLAVSISSTWSESIF